MKLTQHQQEVINNLKGMTPEERKRWITDLTTTIGTTDSIRERDTSKKLLSAIKQTFSDEFISNEDVVQEEIQFSIVEPIETSDKEAEATPTQEPVETSDKEAEAIPAQEPIETSDKEAEAIPTQEPIETSDKEEEAAPAQEPAETPDKEAEAAPAQEPAETSDKEKEAVPAVKEKDSETDNEDSDDESDKKTLNIFKGLFIAAAAAALVFAILFAGKACNGDGVSPIGQPDQTTVETPSVETDSDETDSVETDPVETDPVETESVETEPVETDPVETEPVETEPAETDPIETEPVETDPVETDPVETDPVETEPDTTPAFELSEFKKGTNNLIDYYGGDNANKSDLILLVERIGEDKLAAPCTTYGEIEVQENVAHLLVFGADAQMQVYIADNNLQYNPNYVSDYFAEIDRIDAVYTNATGKYALSVLKDLEGYAIVEGNEEATKALIGDDVELLNWYTAKCAAEEKYHKETVDTKAALDKREEYQNQIVSSNGTIKLLEEQLKNDSFELGKASEAYTQFIDDNYKFVVVGN